VRDLLAQDAGISAIAAATKLSRQTIYRVKDDPAGAEAILAKWERQERRPGQ
jgi:putative DNA-invertase from lambdoid prophage Rac